MSSAYHNVTLNGRAGVGREQLWASQNGTHGSLEGSREPFREARMLGFQQVVYTIGSAAAAAGATCIAIVAQAGGGFAVDMKNWPNWALVVAGFLSIVGSSFFAPWILKRYEDKQRAREHERELLKIKEGSRKHVVELEQMVKMHEYRIAYLLQILEQHGWEDPFDGATKRSRKFRTEILDASADRSLPNKDAKDRQPD